MRKTLWRVLALITGLLVGLTLTAVPAQAAWQPSWNDSAATSSARANGALLISRAEYLDVTQQNRAACGHVDPDTGNYLAPTVPASVRADIARDKAPRYFHAVRYGTLTGNGSQTVTYRSDHAGESMIFLPSAGAQGAWQKVYRHMTVHRAWVADFRGAGCEVWTEIQTAG